MEVTWEPSRDPSLFAVLVRVKHARDLDTVAKAVGDQVAELVAGHVDAARLDAVRANLKYAAITRLDTAARLAYTLATATAPTGDLEFMNKLYAHIDRLKPAELGRVRRQVADGRQLHRGHAGPRR